jgi:hypothetical protein
MFSTISAELRANYNIKDHPRCQHVEKWIRDNIGEEHLQSFFELIISKCEYYPTTYQLEAICLHSDIPKKKEKEIFNKGEMINVIQKLQEIERDHQTALEREREAWDNYHRAISRGESPSRPLPINYNTPEMLFYSQHQHLLTTYEITHHKPTARAIQHHRINDTVSFSNCTNL